MNLASAVAPGEAQRNPGRSRLLFSPPGLGLRQNRKLLNDLKLIWVVQIASQKYSAS
jgi:hypothetical protein